jgi:hypothetical protein
MMSPNPKTTPLNKLKEPIMKNTRGNLVTQSNGRSMKSMTKSAPYQAALRARRKELGLKRFERYVRPEWIPLIDQLIKKLEKQ